MPVSPRVDERLQKAVVPRGCQVGHFPQSLRAQRRLDLQNTAITHLAVSVREKESLRRFEIAAVLHNSSSKGRLELLDPFPGEEPSEKLSARAS